MIDPHRYLEALSPLAMRFGLQRMARALDDLGHPERVAPILHVAGTNGKGSTCAMAAAALGAAGHRTGLYTSPHLERFNERIAVDGEPISDAALAEAVAEVRAACPWHDGGEPEDRLSYFEFATLAALVHFAHARVGVMVLEVGLGGRLDATNAVTPAVTAVAAIGLDHTQWLGDTVEAVAREKAGIFKAGRPGGGPRGPAAGRARGAARGGRPGRGAVRGRTGGLGRAGGAGGGAPARQRRAGGRGAAGAAARRRDRG